MEAYLLLEVAWSEKVISRMQKDLACEIVHHNTITLQLNWLFLENTQNDLYGTDELVGHIHLSIRQSGYSAVCKHTIQEVYLQHRGLKGFFFYFHLEL